MKRFKNKTGLYKLWAVVALCAFSPFLHGDTIEREGADQDVDIQALREWINTKRQVTVKEIGGNLSLSGEVRTEFQATGETVDGVSQRGNGTIFPSRGYDISVNILLDYRSDLTWSSIKLEFDNNAGIFGGTNDRIKLSRAYFGARILNGDSYYVDVEVGRKKIGSIFDSRLEFNSYFDGVVAKYDQSFERIGDIYLHLGTFIIDERKDQYGYVGETGFMNIAGSGFYTKLSLIDWDTKNMHNAVMQHRFDFLVSQMTLGYKFYLSQIRKQVTIYAAGLYNFRAQKLALTNNEKANWGSYIGFSMGELKRRGDWALDVNYQWLAAQCVPDFDVSGIGVGNINDTGLYTVHKNGTGGETSRATAGGEGNYQGASVTLDYLITNNINMQQQWLYSTRLNQDIGPSRRFKQYEIEFIYGF